MRRTIAQNARLHSLISKLGIDEETKQSLVGQFTNGRTSSSAEMDVKECEYLIGHLSVLSGKSNVQVNAISDRLRKRIISKFREMEYNTSTGKADMPRIQATIINKWGAELNRLSDKQLREIIGVLERTWLPHYYKSKTKK